MYGIVDLTHRFKFLGLNLEHTYHSASSPNEKTVSKNLNAEITRQLFSKFASRGYHSIEEYHTHISTLSADLKLVLKLDGKLEAVEIDRIQDTVFLWSTPSDSKQALQKLSSHLKKREEHFGDAISKLGTKIRDIDEKNISFSDIIPSIKDVFAVDDVIVWKYDLGNQYMVQLASTTTKPIHANIHSGIIGEAVKNKRSIYYPNLRNQRNYLDMLQHQAAFREGHWKGLIISPMHLSRQLVGAIGLYSKHDLILSSVETSLLLYLLANLSKRLGREITAGQELETDNGPLTFEKLMRLAPTVYVGTKTTYRLHSIKNKVRTTAEILKNLRRHIPNKVDNGINWRDKCIKAENDTLEIFHELESCLLLGSKKSTRLFKQYTVRSLVGSIRKMLVNNVSSRNISRVLTQKYCTGASFYADPISLEQAIFNIVENSLFFLSNDVLEGRAPKIDVSIVQDGAEIYIKVRDNANGMNEEELENAKIIYFSGKRKGGSGVGLWMTQKIADEHLGDFSIDSSYKGTECTIKLPLSDVGDPSSIQALKENLSEDEE